MEKHLKEYYLYIVSEMEFDKLPTEVLNNIIEFKIGKPEYIALKHSKGLREIQNKYKIEKAYNDYWIERKEHKTTFTLHMMRHAPFPLRNFHNLIKSQKDIFHNFLQNEDLPHKLYIELTGVLVNDDGYGIGQYVSNDIEADFGIDGIENGLYNSAMNLVELLDENDFYDDDYDDYEEIGIQAFIIKLILDKHP